MEVTISEIIEQMNLEKIDIEVEFLYGSNFPIDVCFINIDSGFSVMASGLGYDITRFVDEKLICTYVNNIIYDLRISLKRYKEEDREKYIKNLVKKAEMDNYGWE